ncbi:MAG: COX15/CtaA family protein [Alphaproteobacteria bacterium]|nr:COX15/CtaA family protein [Alphaproteobacteria bacterium]
MAIWLFACCGMVFAMALLGAITRLTESGLSITDWNPVMGALPPLGEAAWNKAFSAYQAIPQYQILNRGMTLEEFKGIYFWEWLHRLWGRLTGVVFALPFLWFLAQRRIDRTTGLKLAGILALGGLQGFIGWFMVQSGLELRTSVSPYRLALHLGFAVLLYALMLWMALGRADMMEVKASKNIQRFGWLVLGLLGLTMIWGALVAGLRAGEAYNTWPLMEGEFLPAAAWALQPKWLNFFENLALVQFIHRWLGPLTVLGILAWTARLWRKAGRDEKFWIYALGSMAILQTALGLATLLTHVDIVLAVAHQAGALMLLSLMLVNLRMISGTLKTRK